MDVFSLPIGPVTFRVDALPDLPIPTTIAVDPDFPPPPRVGTAHVLVTMGDSLPMRGFFDTGTGSLSQVEDESGGETRKTTYDGTFTDPTHATGLVTTILEDGVKVEEPWTITPS